MHAAGGVQGCQGVVSPEIRITVVSHYAGAGTKPRPTARAAGALKLLSHLSIQSYQPDNLTSHCCACTKSTLSTEPFPQPQK